MRRLGNLLSLRERTLHEWGWNWFESVLLDVRLALRSLRRHPAFAAVAVISLAIGIGFTVAIFDLVNALFLRPFPGVTDSARLVSLHQRTRGGLGNYTSASYPEFEYFRTHARAFGEMAAYARFDTSLGAGAEAEEAEIELVSPRYFPVLGTRNATGRTLGPADAGQFVTVLSHDCWTRRFARDPGIVGRSLRIGTGEFVVIGVAPPGFRGLEAGEQGPAAWVPVERWRDAVSVLADEDVVHGWFNQSFSVVARLGPGWSLRRARQDLAGMGARMARDHPERAEGWRDLPAMADVRLEVFPAVSTRLSPDARGETLAFLGLLAGVAGLVLAAACGNLANLLVARTAGRSHELAVRAALGGRTGRLARQLVTENLVLALLGGAAGLLVARWLSRLLLAFGPALASAGRLVLEAGLDVRVILFALGVAVACAVAVTLLPVRMLARQDVAARLDGRQPTGGARASRARGLLASGQVAVTVVLVVVAGLFVSTLRNARAVDVTARSEEVLLGTLDLREAGYADEARGERLYSSVLDRVATLPGVRDAALVMVVPLGGRRGGTNITLEGGGEGGRSIQVGFNVVTPRYFRTVGVRLAAGREFTPDDRPGAPAVAIINQEMADGLFRGRSPLGQRFTLSWPPASVVEIVGVVRDGRFRNFRSAPEPVVYVPLAQRYMPRMSLEVRAAAGSGADVAATVRRALAGLEPRLALTDVRTARAHFERTLARERSMASLMTVLAGVALLLAAIGIYGTVAYAVGQRTREIGIRMALGAPRHRVMADVLGRVLWLTATGVCLGVAVAFGVTRLARTLLFGVSPTDSLVFVAAIALLSVVAAVAAWLPARRAVRVDPVAALRFE